MNKIFGNLEFVSVKEKLDLLSKPVADSVLTFPNSEDILVSEIDPALSDTVAFCECYNIGMEMVANCVILEARRADNSWFAACVVLASTRADVNGLARRTLFARRASFASMDQAVAQSGMEYGAITPLGLPREWEVLVDKAVTELDYVVIGSGLRKSKILIPGKFFTSLSNIKVLENLGLRK